MRPCPDTLDLLPVRDWVDDRREIGIRRLERTGCCGFEALRYSYDVECVDQNGNVFSKYNVTLCGITHKPCPKRELDEMVKLFSILNR